LLMVWFLDARLQNWQKRPLNLSCASFRTHGTTRPH
jgi:hypothetical protein